jgi:uncharacterized protein YndB with AHSA1/START domain
MTPADAVVIAREIDAPVERVWRVWTEGALFAAWIAPTEGTRARAPVFDARPGGAWAVELVEPSGATWRGRGRFVEVERHARLVFTWGWDHRPEESLVTVEFRALGARTQVVLTHARLATEAERRENGQGWIECLDRLAAFT